MDKALENSLVNRPFIRGLLCIDNNGLTIAEKGELAGAPAGRYVSLSRLGSSLCPDQPEPVIMIDTKSRNIAVKDYDSMTIVISCERKNE